MTIEYLKKADITSQTDSAETRELVQNILNDIEKGGEASASEYAAKFDRYDGNTVITRDEIEAASAKVPQKLKDDIRFAHDNVKRFAEGQLKSLSDFDMELNPGFTAGQKAIPVRAAGCYVPGGRYSHIASAIMTATTARVAGVETVSVCSPPRTSVAAPMSCRMGATKRSAKPIPSQIADRSKMRVTAV